MQLLAGARFLGLLTTDLGGWLGDEVDLSAYADRLFAARQAAMQSKDFAEVDRLKAAYVAAGLEVRMSKQGVELVPGPGFDAAKLDGIA